MKKARSLAIIILIFILITNIAVSIQYISYLENPLSNNKTLYRDSNSYRNALERGFNKAISRESSLKELIINFEKYDRNLNKLDDRLEEKLYNLSSESYVYVGIISKSQSFDTLKKSLKALNASIKKSWRAFNTLYVNITKQQLEQIIALYASEISLIYPAWYHAITLNNVAVRLTHVRTIVWNTYGYLGDPNSAIAIIDSGIDDSHYMLSSYSDRDFSDPNVKIVGWYDPTGSSSTPYDNDGHGTHVASIAAGRFYNGDADRDGQVEITIDITDVNVENDGNEYSFLFGFFLNVTGIVNITAVWSAADNTTAYVSRLALTDPNGALIAEDTVNPFNITYNLTSSNFGVWRTYVSVKNTSSTSNPLSIQLILELPLVNSSPPEYSGVAPNAKLVGIPALAGSSTADILDGLNWVYNNAESYHILVVSNSWAIVDDYGNPSTDPGIELAVKKLINKGLVVVAAAGNWGNTLLTDQIGTPGNIDEVITVGACDNNLNVAYYSSRGPTANTKTVKPDVLAPGGDYSSGAIVGADTNDVETYGYEILNSLTMYQGTSMATPHIAGIATILAQVLGGYNNWDYNPADLTKSKAFKIKQILLMTAWEIGTKNGWKDYSEGFGLVQADAAIEALTLTWNYDRVESAYLYDQNKPFKKHVWARNVYLEAGGNYTFYLQIPDTGNFDLYVFAPEPNDYGEPVLVAYSNSTSFGGYETVNIQPNETGYYYIVVKQVDGYGEFQISSFYLSPIYINILSPKNSSWVNSKNITLQWVTKTNYTISQYNIYLNKTLIKSESENSTQTEINIPGEGLWEIKISAIATNGAKGNNETYIIVDITPPNVSILIIPPPSAPGAIAYSAIDMSRCSAIEVHVFDNFFIKNISFFFDNETPTTISNISKSEYSFTISSEETCLSEGLHVLKFIIFDLAGNVNVTTYELNILPHGPPQLETNFGYLAYPISAILLFFALIPALISFIAEPLRTVIVAITLITIVSLHRRKSLKRKRAS